MHLSSFARPALRAIDILAEGKGIVLQVAHVSRAVRLRPRTIRKGAAVSVLQFFRYVANAGRDRKAEYVILGVPFRVVLSVDALWQGDVIPRYNSKSTTQ
jgi:hypothetical protein